MVANQNISSTNYIDCGLEILNFHVCSLAQAHGDALEYLVRNAHVVTAGALDHHALCGLQHVVLPALAALRGPGTVCGASRMVLSRVCAYVCICCNIYAYIYVYAYVCIYI